MILNQNIVLLARQFQPSTIGEYWLINNNIAPADGIYGNKVATDVFSSHSTSLFDIFVTPDRVTFLFKQTAIQTDIIEKIKLFVDATKETAYIAMGINFSFRLTPEGTDLCQFSKLKFSNPLLASTFSGADSIWGTFIQMKSIRESVLHVQAAPAILGNDPSAAPTMMTGEFNFHIKLTPPENARSLAKTTLDHFDEFANEADKLRSHISSAP